MDNEKDNFSDEALEKRIEQWFENKFSGKGNKKDKMCKSSTGAGAGVYCIGFIGAVVYYIGAATSFWDGVLGFLQAMVWPAFLIHGLLTFLKM